MTKHTNKQLRAMFGALIILGNRRMATVGADIKVGRMLRALSVTAEPLKAARQRVVLDVTEGLDLTKLSLLEQQVVQAKIAVAQEELDAQEIEVELPIGPSGPITQADLPREMPGEGGWQNAAQLGAVVSDLGPLFEPAP